MAYKKVIKEKWVSIRVSEAEYNEIQKLKEQKMKPSDLLYFALHNITRKNQVELITEIKKVGNNINQIAYKINQNKETTAEELKKASQELKKLYLEIEDYLNYDI